MTYQHQQQASGQWFNLSLVEQLANIGSEIERAIGWRNKHNIDYSQKAFERSLELLNLTITDKKNINRLKEPLRLREVLVDYFLFYNQYSSSDELWRKYFYSFNYAARLAKPARVNC